MKLTTDGHKVSRGLSATVELLVDYYLTLPSMTAGPSGVVNISTVEFLYLIIGRVLTDRLTGLT